MNFKRSYSDGYFPTRITVLILWIYFFLLMLVYIIQWPFLHWEILIMLLSKFSLAFHHIRNEVPRYGMVYVNLRDVPWKDIFKRSAFAAASEFCEWVQVGIDVYIRHRKY